jgi:hypothetical protein
MRILPVFIGYSGVTSFTNVTLRPHGPLISGSFGLTLNGVPLVYFGSTALPATINAYYLEEAIKAVPGFGNTHVYCLMD